MLSGLLQTTRILRHFRSSRHRGLRGRNKHIPILQIKYFATSYDRRATSTSAELLEWDGYIYLQLPTPLPLYYEFELRYLIVSFDAQPFTSPFPLSFRGTPDTLAAHHLEASECCLIHNDNYLTSSKGIYINPSVRVGYNPSAYDVVHSNSPWPALGEAWRGIWWNRLARWGTTEWFKQRTVKRRVERWRKEGEVVGGETRYETGEGCLINEMQVLIENGWAHV